MNGTNYKEFSKEFVSPLFKHDISTDFGNGFVAGISLGLASIAKYDELATFTIDIPLPSNAYDSKVIQFKKIESSG